MLVLYAFLRHAVGFLCALLLLRPALDPLLVSVRVSLAGVDIGLGGLVALGLTLATVVYVLASPNTFNRLHEHPIVWMYVTFLFVAVIAWAQMDDKAEGMKVLARLGSVFSILLLVIVHIQDAGQARQLLRAMLYSAIIPIGWGFWTVARHGGRLEGTFEHPNILAFFLLVVIGCVLFQVDRPADDRRASRWRVVALLMLLGALLLTKTRSGWAAALMMSGLYALLFKRAWLLPLIALTMLLAITPLVKQHVLNTMSRYGHRMAVNEQSSLGWRLETWSDLMKRGVQRPFFGYGLNADYRMVREHLGAHNDYLRWFLEAGIVGVVAYFAPYLYLLMHAIRHRQMFPPESLPAKLAGLLICFIPAFLLMSLTENLASYVVIHWYLWALIGMYVVSHTPSEPAHAPHPVAA